jgi:peptidyl-prolyl cis-trans isomerase SurA
MMEDRLSYMVEQIGSLDKVVKYYKKDSEEEFRTYFRYFERREVEFRNAKENCRWCRNHPRSSKLFQKIPAADLPFFGVELEVAQIVVTQKFPMTTSKSN